MGEGANANEFFIFKISLWASMVARRTTQLLLNATSHHFVIND